MRSWNVEKVAKGEKVEKVEKVAKVDKAKKLAMDLKSTSPHEK